MTSLGTLALSAVPSLPTRCVIDTDASVLVWMIAGEAEAQTAQRRTTIVSGEALWVPAGHRTVVRAGSESCLLPIRIRERDRAAGPRSPITLPVPSLAHGALLAAFTRSLGVLRGGGVEASVILGALGQSNPLVEVPSLPRSLPLRRVAEHMLDQPTTAPREIATALGLSESVLTRQFRAETGFTPVRWRTRHLLARAAEQIVKEGSVAAGRTLTAYESPQAFARAFRREWGITPGELLLDAPGAGPLPRRSDTLGPQQNGYHIVFWVASGRAHISIGAHRQPVHTGDVFCLSAGESVAYRTDPGTAVLPLGWLPGGTPVGSGVLAHVGDDATRSLLCLAAWAYAGVTPLADINARDTLAAVLRLDPAPPLPTAIAASTFALLDQLFDSPADTSSLAELAAQAGMAPAQLSAAIDVLTGTTLPIWRARTRMTWARRLLRDGAHPQQVARKLGYSEAASFTRAFRRAHGCSPTQFRQREATSTA